jgi:ribosomal-protein-alanine N-acetyltransferase
MTLTELVTIRPMQIEDLEAVLAIDRQSFSLPWPESAYRYELLQNSASLCLVAETEGMGGMRQVVGMVVVWIIMDEAHIATLAVHPSYRRSGIGSRLLTEALERSVGRGARRAMLEVRASNVIAQTMYEHFGFKVVYRRPKYYRDNNEDALLMDLENLEETLNKLRGDQ